MSTPSIRFYVNLDSKYAGKGLWSKTSSTDGSISASAQPLSQREVTAQIFLYFFTTLDFALEFVWSYKSLD